MSLRVHVKNASDLPNIERIGKSDPFVVLKFRELKRETKVIPNNLDPVWNETFLWTLQSPICRTDTLAINVYDKEKIGKDRLLGSAEFQLHILWQEKHKTVTLQLKPSKKAGKHDKATITLEFDHVSLSDKILTNSEGGTTTSNSEEQPDTNLEQSDRIDAPESMLTVVGHTGHTMKRRANRKTKGQVKLPDKEIEFQVNITVIECRKLEGKNVSPIVKITCFNKFKKTSAKKETNQPVFEDTFIFKFKKRPVEFFEKKIELKVMDTKKAVKESTIGSFTIDIGTIYNEEDHSIWYKWLLLTHHDDPSGEAKGFLKASFSVLGPDDDNIVPPSASHPDNVDIEFNLLRPSGARLQPATQIVKVYSAEDLPQMDPEYFEKIKSFLSIGNQQKELVDPYAVVSYAGYEGSTEVKWNTQRPEWNEQINLGFRFPSISDRIRLQLKDKDRLNADDYIGTCYVNIPDISASGENGFLPTFGPTYVNVYGSPREFSEFSDKFEHLNKGELEGVAYRGRMLIEVETVLGRLPTELKEKISATECRKLQVYQGKKKYKLFAIFLSASMISPGKKAVEFEISIGNYGNKLETTIVSQSSTTKPEVPVYDGHSQFFLDWGANKPCLLVDSFWEDCQFRIESLNFILSIADHLSTELEEIKDRIKMSNFAAGDISRKVTHLCSEILEKLSIPLPQMPQEGYTKLDKKLYSYRQIELDAVRAIIDEMVSRRLTLEDRLDTLDTALQRIQKIAIESQNSIPDVCIWMLSDNQRVAYHRIPSHLLMFSKAGPQWCGKLCGRQQTILLKPPAPKNEKELECNQNEALMKMILWLGYDKDISTNLNQSSDLQDNSHALLSDKNPHNPRGDIVTYAETYENEAFIGKWTPLSRKLTIPHFSDATGKVKQNKEYFDPPPAGWEWDGPWFLHPELSNCEDTDTGVYTVEIYEVQTREVMSSWPESFQESIWSDAHGEVLMNYDINQKEIPLTINDIEAPSGWEWTSSQWIVDLQGAVNHDGWAYSSEHYDANEGFIGSCEWIPIERNIHITRRRRWFRTREKTSYSIRGSFDEAVEGEGWEYAHRPNYSAYHPVRHSLDFFRRRRWHRKLKNTDYGKACVFYFKDKSGKSASARPEDSMYDEGKYKEQTPRLYLTFHKDNYSIYQLRAHLYQARNIYGGDSTGLSDAFAVVCCGRYSAKSRVIPQSLSPQWNQTLEIRNIRLYGSPYAVTNAPPSVVIKFYDKDTIGQDEYLGRVMVQPKVIMSADESHPVLEWFQITRFNSPAGEILATFELIKIDKQGPGLPELTLSDAGPYFEIPKDILPKMCKKKIEVLCWGVRDVKRLLTLPVKNPFVEIECGGQTKQTGIVKNASKNPMFESPFLLALIVDIPVQAIYAPPLNIKVYDKRKFGHTPLVGSTTITSLGDFDEDSGASVGFRELKRVLTIRPSNGHVVEADGVIEHTVIEMSPPADDSIEDDSRMKYDWWSKYYYSISDEDKRIQDGYKEDGQDKLIVYDGTLEKEFGNFEDFVHTLPLFRGKNFSTERRSNDRASGYFKGAIKIYNATDNADDDTPRLRSALPIKWPQEAVVRVYVIRGIDLSPRDIGGTSDPYIVVKVGKKHYNNKDEYIVKDLNPVFGKMFELDVVLPFDRNLTVTIMDHDILSADDVIGSTEIDLENRFLSLHRAHAGLPQTFQKKGQNKWRDFQLPSVILHNMSKVHQLPEPVWRSDTEVVFKNKHYTLNSFEEQCKVPREYLGNEKERLALYVLREQNMVFEHIENRPLYNPIQPDESQGHLHMWVDIFPKLPGCVLPPPLDISPRKPEKFELRIVIWNTSDVLLDDRSAITGEDMSDIYVKGFLTGTEDIQKTDVHYRCMDGDGMFNWRFVFPFDYLVQEKVMVAKVKEHFYSLEKTEKRIPVHFNLNVWDNDLISKDDLLGMVDFDLHSMPKLAKTSRSCNLKQLDEQGANLKRVNIFEQKHVKGWLPVYQKKHVAGRPFRNNKCLTGKVELEIELLTEEEAIKKPAGRGQDEPNLHPHLDKPNRPDSSFALFQSPAKTAKLIWRHHKCKIILAIILICLLFLL